MNLTDPTGESGVPELLNLEDVVAIAFAPSRLFDDISKRADTGLNPPLGVGSVMENAKSGGRTQYRTADLYHVKVALYH